jgi:hypothetical protein
VALPGLADRAEKRARHGVSELGEIAGDCSAWEDESRSGAHDASTVMRSQSPPEPKATPRAQSSAEYRRGAGMLERGPCDTIRPGFASFPLLTARSEVEQAEARRRLIADSPAEDVVDQYGRTWKVVRLPATFATAPVPMA